MIKHYTYKKIMTPILILLLILHSFSSNYYVEGAVKNDVSYFLNATEKYLHLGVPGSDTFEFYITGTAMIKKARLYWYVKTDKGNPEAVTIDSNTGKVTAKSVGTAYIRCRITLPSGTVYRPEAKVIVRNNISSVEISNISANRIAITNESIDFNRVILNSNAGKKFAASGITRWEIQEDTTKTGVISSSGIVTPTKEGSFQIRAVCFQSISKYNQWLKDKVAYSNYITAASKWYTITVIDIAHQSVIANQIQLEEALADENVRLIYLSTEMNEKFKIENGNYCNKSLVVDAPNADVENKANFEYIIIRNIKDNTWIEYADGNKIYLDDTKTSIVIDKDSIVKELIIDRPNSDINIIVNGSVGHISLQRAAQVRITGINEQLSLSIDNTAAGSVVTTNIPLNLEVNADADILLIQGAEGTAVQSYDVSADINIMNQTRKDIPMIEGGKVVKTIHPVDNEQDESEDLPIPMPPNSPTPIPLSDDHTLRELRLQMQNVLNLSGIAVINPSIETGAYFEVRINDEYSGVTVTPNHSSANYEVTVNNILISSTDLVTYTLVPGDVIIIKVTAENSNEGYYKITMKLVNSDSVSENDSIEIYEDSDILIDVLSNDTDPDGDALSIASFTQGSQGTVTQEGNALRYTPDANYEGADSFTYEVSDGNGGTSAGTVNVTVNGVNDVPTANADTETVNEDSTILIDVLANDTDIDGDTLSLSSFTQGAYGEVVQEGNSLRYTPAVNYSGADSFTYTLSDGNGETASAEVVVTVAAVNDAPIAGLDSISVNEDSNVLADVLSNDTDEEGDALSIASFTQGSQGTVTQEGNALRYTPDVNYEGADSFTYEVSDGNGGTSAGTVNVTVNGVNDVPTANADTETVNEDSTILIDVLANDTDIDGDTLSLSSFTQGAYGEVVQEGNSLRYTPAVNYSGADSFTYTISDSKGGINTATVSITVLNTSILSIDIENELGYFEIPFTVEVFGTYTIQTSFYKIPDDTLMQLANEIGTLDENEDYAGLGTYSYITYDLVPGANYVIVLASNVGYLSCHLEIKIIH